MSGGAPHAPVALVTGASNGLGAAFCQLLGEAGCRMVTVDHEAPAAPADAQVHFNCDLADPGQVDRLIGELIDQGPYSIVILNAGASATGRFATLPAEVSERLIRLNAETPMVMASSLAREGAFTNPASLIFISSLSRYTGYPGAAAYAASKDAIAVYAASIRKPFAALGITVSCAFPGPLRTAHAERHAPAGANAQARMEPVEAAARILGAARRRKKVILPGTNAQLAAAAGRLFPGLTARLMRRMLHDRLDRDVF